MVARVGWGAIIVYMLQTVVIVYFVLELDSMDVLSLIWFFSSNFQQLFSSFLTLIPAGDSLTFLPLQQPQYKKVG